MSKRQNKFLSEEYERYPNGWTIEEECCWNRAPTETSADLYIYWTASATGFAGWTEQVCVLSGIVRVKTASGDWNIKTGPV